MPRKSIMSNLTDEQFAQAVLSSKSYAAICRTIGLRVQGSNYKTIQRRMKRQELTPSHFVYYPAEAISRNKKPTSEILVQNSAYADSSSLKGRLIKEGLLIDACTECGNQGKWRDKPLTLQLDHINGDHRDNRLENLELWTTSQPSGQRVIEKIQWCKEFLALYENLDLLT